VTPGGSSLPLKILSGRADDMRAEIAVQVACDDASGGEQLHVTGTLVGPRRGRDMTLPTTVKLVDVTGDRPGEEAGQSAFARAVFTEPAYWTPELPNLYRLQAHVRRGDRTVAVYDEMIGLRRLGVRGRSLWLEGRRWVPRGLTIPTTDFDPVSLRSLSAAAVIDDPSDEICVMADQAGVAIIARLMDLDLRPLAATRVAERIAAWSLHPSVVLAVVPRLASDEQAAAIVAAARPLKGTMLIGLEVDGTQPPDAVTVALVDAVDCLIVDLPRDGLPHDAWRSGGSWRRDTSLPDKPPKEKPLLAQRLVATETATEHRQECDRLQASLAAWGLARAAGQLPWDWAGYLCAAW